MSGPHCDTCTCETAADRKRRLEQEKQRRERELREQEFVRRHSILRDEDIEWARNRLLANIVSR